MSIADSWPHRLPAHCERQLAIQKARAQRRGDLIGRNGRERQIVGEIAAPDMMRACQTCKPRSGIIEAFELDAFEPRARDVLVLHAEESDEVHASLRGLAPWNVAQRDFRSM